jgi:hypothetical protein
MSKFIIVYLGGRPPSSPEEGQQHMASYQQWLVQLGEKAVSPANPLKSTHVIDSQSEVSEGSEIAMSGYTIIETDSIEDAIIIAKDCPFLALGGKIEVSELIAMPSMG